MKLGRGAGDPARHLPAVDPIGEEGKRLGLVVAQLQFGLGVVDRAAVDPRRRAGLESAQLEAEPQQSAGSARRWSARPCVRRAMVESPT